MKQDKKSPILKVAMFPYTVLKYAYIGVLAVLGKNKMRHVKADVKTDVAEASSEQSVVPIGACQLYHMAVPVCDHRLWVQMGSC